MFNPLLTVGADGEDFNNRDEEGKEDDEAIEIEPFGKQMRRSVQEPEI